MDLDALQQGISAARQGRRAEARAWLREALRQNPNSEQAWLWLSTVVETDSEYQMCLERALAINPLNETTRARLQDALRGGHRGSASRRPPPASPPRTSASPSKTAIPKVSKPASAPVAPLERDAAAPAPSIQPLPHPAAPPTSVRPDVHEVASEADAERAFPTIPLPALAVMGCLTVTAISGLLVLIALLLMGWAS
ncbi:MAG: hypothetical protein DDG58_14370 [Ardenticatenia bacterium]|jgi:hypothetical protein|nr:MAG: hypothetical protein DDG58_14370 [Ardenticatenia bacterium]